MYLKRQEYAREDILTWWNEKWYLLAYSLNQVLLRNAQNFISKPDYLGYVWVLVLDSLSLSKGSFVCDSFCAHAAETPFSKKKKKKSMGRLHLCENIEHLWEYLIFWFRSKREKVEKSYIIFIVKHTFWTSLCRKRPLQISQH